MLKRIAAIAAVLLAAVAITYSMPSTVKASGSGCGNWYGTTLHHSGPPTDFHYGADFLGCTSGTVVTVQLHEHDSSGWHLIDQASLTVGSDFSFNLSTDDRTDTCSNARNYAVVAKWYVNANLQGQPNWGPTSGLNACN
jgi:hypothetical protein